MALLTGFLFVAALGLLHHFGILCVRACTPPVEHGVHRPIIIAFSGMLVLHTLEIIAGAGFYAVLLWGGWFGGLGGEFQHTFDGLVYFSGINFVTLGYTQINTDGPIRMINMMQSLGGFMILTWSATFIYSIWQEAVDKGRA